MGKTRGVVALRALKRARAIMAVFAAVQILIVFFGVLGLEGVNILRTYAAGEAHWSKAQKNAIINLSRFAQTRADEDYRRFENNMKVIEGDRQARLILSQMRLFPTHEEHARAAASLVQGGNAPQDVSEMVVGYLLLKEWPIFDAAVAAWTRGDGEAEKLLQLGRKMRAAADRHAPAEEMNALLSRALELDRPLTQAENTYAQNLGRAARMTKFATITGFVTLSLIACGMGMLFVWRISRAGVQAELRAVENETRVRDFAELASDWFCEIDENRRIRFVATRLSDGADSTKLSGCDWIETGLAQGFRRLSDDIRHQDTLATRMPFREHTFKQTWPDGREIYWSLSGKPITDETGAFRGFRITGSNITSMIQAEEKLKRARDEAERANKAKSAFLANVSHELRTPLNAILGFSSLIENQALGEIGNKRYAEYAGDIRESGEHLLALINDLLEHSRVEAGRIELREEKFDITAAIEQARMFCQQRADKNSVRLSTHLPPNLPLVFGDELRLRQVLINLVSNAVKFTPGGDVSITAHREKDGSLLLEVRDTGIGMDEAGIEQALKPFGQVDNSLSRKFEGTGLGLPLAKSLVELHGGTLSITSERGAGTVVSVRLPAWRIDGTQTLAIA